MKISGQYLITFLLLCLFILPVFAQNNTDALSTYRSGREYENSNRMAEANFFYNAAVRICNDEVARNIATTDTYTVLTWTLQRQQKYQEVITWGERGLRLFPDESRIMETMGEAYFYLDNHEESLKFMQRYINLAPRGERISVAYFFSGEIYRYRKQYHHADIAYSTAVRLEPGLALWWYRLGTVREAAGDYLQAINAYEQAIKLNPNHREAGEGLARMQKQAG